MIQKAPPRGFCFGLNAYHAVALKSDGTVWEAGYNAYGQLGDGTSTNSRTFEKVLSNVTPVIAGQYHTLALKSDDTLWAIGYNVDGELGD